MRPFSPWEGGHREVRKIYRNFRIQLSYNTFLEYVRGIVKSVYQFLSILVSVNFDQNQIVVLPAGDGANAPSPLFIGRGRENFTSAGKGMDPFVSSGFRCFFS
jgi:hypothetical protein